MNEKEKSTIEGKVKERPTRGRGNGGGWYVGEEDSRVAFAYIMMEMLPFSSLTTHLGPDDSDDGESNDHEEVMVLLWQSSKRLPRTSKLLILVIQTRADKRNLSSCRMRNRGNWQSC